MSHGVRSYTNNLFSWFFAVDHDEMIRVYSTMVTPGSI